jgi:hypothetical protein
MKSKDIVHPDPNAVEINARYFKDNPEFRKQVIKMLLDEQEKGPGPGGGGVYPKNRKPLFITHAMLWKNGYMARGVEGLNDYRYTFKQIKQIHPTITKEHYLQKRKKYLLDEK